MKRRDFLRLSALGAASLQAKELGSAEQALFDKQSGLSANKFGAFYVKTISQGAWSRPCHLRAMLIQTS